MRPRQAFLALEALCSQNTSPLYRKGVRLSRNDTQTVYDTYLQWLLLCTDLGYLSLEVSLRDARRLWTDLVRVDVLTLNDAFSKCLDNVRHQDRCGFQAHCSIVSVHLFALLKADWCAALQGDVHSGKRLVQLFSYTSRLSLTDIDLKEQMLDDYLANEEAVKQSFPRAVVDSLNTIVREWFGSYGPDELLPRHGPGGVAELGRCSLEQKYKLLTSDQLLRYAIPLADTTDVRLDRCSRTIFVPKSYKTFRTISMEPASLQYYQQAVWREIERGSSRSGLRRFVSFRDQTANQRLARLGSLNRNYATIDLSSASDLVSYELVKEVFRGTWLLKYLVATRSRETLLPDGRRIQLRKFAPMGSSLCFPVETIIFSAVCAHVAKSHGVSEAIAVFGDDIVVPFRISAPVMRLLSNLGFRVNHSKTFTDPDCWYRESCGAEYLDGFDVSPLRVSRKYASRDFDVRLVKLIDLANRSFQYGFRNLRYFFIHKLRENNWVPNFAPTELLSDSYTNYHAEHRWNVDLQRYDVRCTTLRSRNKKTALSNQDEVIRLRHWFESTAHRRLPSEVAFESIVCQPSVELSLAWVRDDEYSVDHAATTVARG